MENTVNHPVIPLPDKKYLTRAEAAEYLRAYGRPITVSTLAKMAHLKIGPRQHKLGKHVGYTIPDLIKFVDGPNES